jgi:hypothetical protein
MERLIACRSSTGNFSDPDNPTAQKRFLENSGSSAFF